MSVKIPLSPEAISGSILSSMQSLQFDLETWDANPRIGRILSKSVLAGGKRIRPLMTFLMGDLFALPHDTIAPYGRAVELVHASTLAHDDVIDNADSRRGQPSINAISSNKQAVLAGDYLLAYVLNDIATRGRNDIVQELAAIIGDLAEGEWLQIENAAKTDLGRKDVELVALKKTASVLRWCCTVPARLQNHSPEVIELAKVLGESVGVAFQLTDDILDFKRRDGAEFADLKNGVINAVIFELLAAKTGSDTLNMNDKVDLDLTTLELEPAIAKTRQRVEELIGKAKQALQQIVERIGAKDNPEQMQAVQALGLLMDYLTVRAA